MVWSVLYPPRSGSERPEHPRQPCPDFITLLPLISHPDHLSLSPEHSLTIADISFSKGREKSSCPRRQHQRRGSKVRGLATLPLSSASDNFQPLTRQTSSCSTALTRTLCSRSRRRSVTSSKRRRNTSKQPTRSPFSAVFSVIGSGKHRSFFEPAAAPHRRNPWLSGRAPAFPSHTPLHARFPIKLARFACSLFLTAYLIRLRQKQARA